MTDIYRSRISTEAWEPDDEIGGWAHMLFDHGATKVGLWRAWPDPPVGLVEAAIPSRETVLVLEGGVRVTVDGGEPHELGVGDMLSMPEGSLVGWDPSPDCLVFWVYS